MDDSEAMHLEPRKQLGNQGEALAYDFLRQKGYKLVQRNFSCKTGEIDLIMQKGQELVFVEVRSKCSSRYGQPAETVNRSKQEKLRKTAQAYLYRHPELAQYYCRFDVIAILWEKGLANIEWIADAFQ
jgi:putative endonuclease